MDATLRATARLEACIAETVGLMERAAGMVGAARSEAVLCELELLVVNLEELLDDDTDPAAQADGEAVVRQARLLCTGAAVTRERRPSTERTAA